MSEKRDKNGWPEEIYVSASPLTGKMFAHLETSKGRVKYIRADAVKNGRNQEGG